MKILCADTSTSTMHLSYVVLDEMLRFVSYEVQVLANGIQHSEQLVPQALGLCERNNCQFNELDLLVCTNGPGSFTGLRVAMSAFKGISLASGVPLVSIPTLDALAYCIPETSVLVVPVIDARKRRFYAALYKQGKKLTADLDIGPEQLDALLQGYEQVLLTGPDAELAAKQLKECKDHLRVDSLPSTQIGLVLAKKGLEKFLSDGADALGSGPKYVRKSDAELALEEKIRSTEGSHD